jgi:hypothetical protein
MPPSNAIVSLSAGTAYGQVSYTVLTNCTDLSSAIGSAIGFGCTFNPYSVLLNNLAAGTYWIRVIAAEGMKYGLSVTAF